MTHVQLKRKVICESSIRPRGMGPYAIYSFLLTLISDADKAVKFMQREGYSNLEISRARSNRHRDLKKTKPRIKA